MEVRRQGVRITSFLLVLGEKREESFLDAKAAESGYRESRRPNVPEFEEKWTQAL